MADGWSARVTTTPALLADRADRFRDELAVVDGDVALTFGELSARATRVAAGLIDRGVCRGDTVAVWAPNGFEWIVSALGLQMAGAALLPLNTRFKGAEVRALLARTRAVALVSVGTFLDIDYPMMLADPASDVRDSGLVGGLDSLRYVFTLGESQAPWATPWAELSEGSSVSEDAAWARARTVRDDDVCDVLFTSGTTGMPKGAMCTHGVTVHAYETFVDHVGIVRGDRYLIVNPFFHAFGYKAGWLSCLIAGATAYPLATFDVAKAVDTVTRERITVFPGPPTVYYSMLESGLADRTKLASLRLSITGAATVPEELVRRMQRDLTFEDILVGYGLTEANGLGTMCRPGTAPDVVAATSGPPITGMDLRIVDDAGDDLGVGEPGEIWLRGHQMKGYLDDPVATAEAIDADGWLRTGDIGFVDAGGNLHVTDRKKDMFIVGGFNVYPAEVERLLLAHPAVSQVAVVGVPDARLGEVGHAFVIERPGQEVDRDELLEWSRATMANFKVPRYVTMCDEFPLTANGKVLKTALREMVSRDS
jgi:acyl-CoA synthetase (AMP-forming)/AMP-acid ligase II